MNVERGSVQPAPEMPAGMSDSQAESKIMGLLNPKVKEDPKPSRRPNYDEMGDDDRRGVDEELERDERVNRRLNGDDVEPEDDQKPRRKAKDEAEDINDEPDAGDDDTEDDDADDPLDLETLSLSDEAPPKKVKLKDTEVEFNGKKYTVPAALVEGAMLREDYDKQHGVLKQRTAVFAKREALLSVDLAIASELAPATSMLNTMKAQLKQQAQALQSIDAGANVAAYVQHKQSLDRLQGQIAEMESAINERKGVLSQKRTDELKSLGQACERYLKATLPAWDASVQAKVEAQMAAEGFTPEELANMVDPRIIKLAHDAAMLNALRARTTAVRKQIKEAAPVVRPTGRPSATASAKAQSVKLRDRVKSTGRTSDAETALTNILRRARS